MKATPQQKKLAEQHVRDNNRTDTPGTYPHILGESVQAREETEGDFLWVDYQVDSGQGVESKALRYTL